MFNPLSLYASLPDGAKRAVEQTPFAAGTVLVISTYISGVWMSTRACEGLRNADQKQVTELVAERDLYRSIALKGIASTEDLARASIQKIEAVSPDKETRKAAGPVPVVMRTQPVTQSEKAAVEKPSTATDPKTLQIRQDNAIKVVAKTAPANATIQPVKKD